MLLLITDSVALLIYSIQTHAKVFNYLGLLSALLENHNLQRSHDEPV